MTTETKFAASHEGGLWGSFGLPDFFFTTRFCGEENEFVVEKRVPEIFAHKNRRRHLGTSASKPVVKKASRFQTHPRIARHPL